MFGMHRTVVEGEQVAHSAALLADPSRAAMIVGLVDGVRLPAFELARLANVSRSTASEHLTRLVEAEILASERCGRHTYYSIANPEVAQAIEALALVTQGAEVNSLRSAKRAAGLTQARLCYDHLAGRLGVLITEALLTRGLLLEVDGALQPDGAAWNARQPMGLSCPVRRMRRPLTRTCIDWTMRRPHVAGFLGAEIASTAMARGWVRRIKPTERALRVTEVGLDGFAETFGLTPQSLRELAESRS